MGVLGLYAHADISVDLRTGRDVPLPLAVDGQCQLAIVVDLPLEQRLKDDASQDAIELIFDLIQPVIRARIIDHGQAMSMEEWCGGIPVLQGFRIDSQGQDYARHRFPECFDLLDLKLSMRFDCRRPPSPVYVSRGCGRRMLARFHNGALCLRIEKDSRPLDPLYKALDQSSIGRCNKLKEDQPLVRHLIGLSVDRQNFQSPGSYLCLRVGAYINQRRLQHFQVALYKKSLARGLLDSKLIKSYKEFCAKASAMNLDNILVRQSRTQATLIAWQSNPGNLHRELVQYHDCLSSLPTYEEVVDKDGPSEILNTRRCFRRTLTLSKYDDDLSAWAQADLIPGTNEVIDI
ncbi:hypothetical protein PYCC9005_004649 [Savitreella phatthalungensis]